MFNKKNLILQESLSIFLNSKIHNMKASDKAIKNSFSYHKLSSHFKFSLDELFEIRKFNRVIIVEDDLDVSSDFFDYFSALAPILDRDPTVWCISAWNDHGLVRKENMRERERE